MQERASGVMRKQRRKFAKAVEGQRVALQRALSSESVTGTEIAVLGDLIAAPCTPRRFLSFEYWITHDDADYNQLMTSVQARDA
eukprot:100096-Pleurochrysis_carterae.AAC.1